jgi:hypothetical protein
MLVLISFFFILWMSVMPDIVLNALHSFFCNGLVYWHAFHFFVILIYWVFNYQYLCLVFFFFRISMSSLNSASMFLTFYSDLELTSLLHSSVVWIFFGIIGHFKKYTFEFFVILVSFNSVIRVMVNFWRYHIALIFHIP